MRWYLRYKLSLRDLVEMMNECGLTMSHTTIMRWVQRYVPEFEKRWNRYARKAGHLLHTFLYLSILRRHIIRVFSFRVLGLFLHAWHCLWGGM